MSNVKIQRLLESHCIEWIEEGGIVYALDHTYLTDESGPIRGSHKTEEIRMTGKTLGQIRSWLGY